MLLPRIFSALTYTPQIVLLKRWAFWSFYLHIILSIHLADSPVLTLWMLLSLALCFPLPRQALTCLIQGPGFFSNDCMSMIMLETATLLEEFWNAMIPIAFCHQYWNSCLSSLLPATVWCWPDLLPLFHSEVMSKTSCITIDNAFLGWRSIWSRLALKGPFSGKKGTIA